MGFNSAFKGLKIFHNPCTDAHKSTIQICRQKSTHKRARQGSAVDKRAGYGVGGPRILDMVKNFSPPPPHRLPGIKQPGSKTQLHVMPRLRMHASAYSHIYLIGCTRTTLARIHTYIQTLHTHIDTLHTYIKYRHNLYLHIYIQPE